MKRMKKMMGLFKRLKIKKRLGITERNPEQTSNVNADNPTSSNAAANANERAFVAGEPSSSTGVRTFTYKELADATDNFRSDLILGQGGSSIVYKGKLLDTNEVVAIKFLNPDTGEKKSTKHEFDVEVRILSRADHPNLVKLIGSCDEGDWRLLVYEYMPLGSLESHLHDLRPSQEALDWNTRMEIALGVAKGLDYLHNQMNSPMIYRDLKSANILLGDGYHTKLSDFGLAKTGPLAGESVPVAGGIDDKTRVMGTYGYCAPEYAMTGFVTTKSDIFSFGVVLLEIVSGRKAVLITENGRQTYLSDLVRPILDDDKVGYLQLADPKLNDEYPPTGLVRALTIVSRCIREADVRPNAAELVNALGFLARQRYGPDTPSHSTLRRCNSF